MSESTQAALVPAVEVARQTDLRTASNGIRFAGFGDVSVTAADLDRLVNAAPAAIAAALHDSTYFFVPLAMAERKAEGTTRAAGHRERPEETMISAVYSPELADHAICHRNVELSAEREGVFISTRLLPDRFALAFEFFINASHAFVDVAGVPNPFCELVWRQAVADVRGETSQDAWENRSLALAPARDGTSGPDERAKTAYLDAAFSDAVAIYMLSLAIDIDYAELRERDYPLLAPQALAERLRHVNQLFPPNPGYEFAIKYRRRG